MEGDIVLESSSRISLKSGGSFIVIHAGGVDIMGPKINLNGGGSAGVPVSTLQPGVLGALEDDDKDDDAEDGEDNGDGGDDGAGGGDESGNGGSGDGDDEQDDAVFDEQFLLLDDEDNPIPFQKYKITTGGGKIYSGITDQDGKTERITTPEAEELVFEYDLDELE
ncbi:TPA: type IV secretion protein Rhs [Salmonella enterica subsp. salamae serovar 9,46:z4,z24:z39:z42]|nr:type IV secretion protein Rhs [Salmonella enterica subsp. salamae serovar 9,46:z4,z24:z39:z42]